ncbi:antibiotic biosynthesis monooxygenase [Nocardioides sp. C4-1]|uniref:putative quinol monooxygenase n=1 Tax=Nocardioides sp. C4-1 TaxID=3151851 RepID=UPI003263146E
MVGTVMIIVAGHVQVAPEGREAYLRDCIAVVNAGRAADGCLDFAISPDLVDPGRINIHERWTARPELEAFRGSGPPPTQQDAMLAIAVEEFEVAEARQ